MKMKYWKANKTLVKKIHGLNEIAKNQLATARQICKDLGGDGVYTSTSFGSTYISGFEFKDEKKVDKKVFVRIRKTENGWRPKANTKLYKALEKLKSDHVSEVMKLIGMEMFYEGLKIQMPGVYITDSDVYLELPEHVNPKGCKRISDIEFEKTINAYYKLARKRKCD